MFYFSQVYFCNTYLFNSFAVETVLPAHAASSYITLLESVLPKKCIDGVEQIKILNAICKQCHQASPQAHTYFCPLIFYFSHPPRSFLPTLLTVSFICSELWILHHGTPCAADPRATHSTNLLSHSLPAHGRSGMPWSPPYLLWAISHKAVSFAGETILDSEGSVSLFLTSESQTKVLSFSFAKTITSLLLHSVSVSTASLAKLLSPYIWDLEGFAPIGWLTKN